MRKALLVILVPFMVIGLIWGWPILTRLADPAPVERVRAIPAIEPMPIEIAEPIREVESAPVEAEEPMPVELIATKSEESADLHQLALVMPELLEAERVTQEPERAILRLEAERVTLEPPTGTLALFDIEQMLELKVADPMNPAQALESMVVEIESLIGQLKGEVWQPEAAAITTQKLEILLIEAIGLSYESAAALQDVKTSVRILEEFQELMDLMGELQQSITTLIGISQEIGEVSAYMSMIATDPIMGTILLPFVFYGMYTLMSDMEQEFTRLSDLTQEIDERWDRLEALEARE